jgi:serine/threonine protein kinase
LYLTLSLVEGGDVYANLEAQPSKSFPVETCRFYAYEIFLALDWMHKKRIIYRDLKAENVLIGNDGHIVMTDLGLAKHWKDPDAVMHSTSICGTPEYMPPEVIREEGHGIAMDYWGLGVLTYEMMCGNTPFSSDDAKGLFVNILMHDPAFPEEIPDDACQVKYNVVRYNTRYNMVPNNVHSGRVVIRLRMKIMHHSFHTYALRTLDFVSLA